MKILLRTNSGQEGLGHLNRMYSIYKAFKLKYNEVMCYFRVNFDSQERLLKLGVLKEEVYISEMYDHDDIISITSLSFDIVILDSYKMDENYIRNLKLLSKNSKIALLDDFNLYKDIYVDFLINGNIYGEKMDYKNRVNFEKGFFGLDYLILNPIYWEVEDNLNIEGQSIMITSGGADNKRAIIKIIEKLKVNKNFQYIKKRIIIGPFFHENYIIEIKKIIDSSYELVYFPSGLINEIFRSKLIISAAGSTVYEVLRLRKPLITYVIGEDQKFIERELRNNKVISLGDIENINCLKDNSFEGLDINVYNRKLESLYKQVDGKGATRLIDEMMLFAKE